MLLRDQLLSENMVVMLAQRRAGGWMPREIRETHGPSLLAEARGDLEAIADALSGRASGYPLSHAEEVESS